jgi:hypothetical protein
LAGFGISEIQNGEGRYVAGKLEYGYTDHIGNLRLSYKDSLRQHAEERFMSFRNTKRIKSKPKKIPTNAIRLWGFLF